MILVWTNSEDIKVNLWHYRIDRLIRDNFIHIAKGFNHKGALVSRI